MMIVVAPAKLNLTLEVLSKREDGYHEEQDDNAAPGKGNLVFRKPFPKVRSHAPHL